MIPISPPGEGPYPDLSRFDSGYITLINPCLVKGITIFKGLVEAFPQLEFAAVPTWGTTTSDLSDIRSYPNVTVLRARDDIREIFQLTRVLLFPSLWAEAHGMTVIEAMLHGIPVVASALGGIIEAKYGVDYLMPVNPILSFTQQFDDRMIPVPVVPAQNLAPWIDAIAELTSNKRRYMTLSEQSRVAAMAGQENENIEAFSDYLMQMSTAALSLSH